MRISSIRSVFVHLVYCGPVAWRLKAVRVWKIIQVIAEARLGVGARPKMPSLIHSLKSKPGVYSQSISNEWSLYI